LADLEGRESEGKFSSWSRDEGSCKKEDETETERRDRV